MKYGIAWGMVLWIGCITGVVFAEKVFTEEEMYVRMLTRYYGDGSVFDTHVLDPYIRKERGIVNDDQVRVRSLPTLHEGTILGAVQRGEEVEVYGKSSFTERIGNDEARWVQIAWKRKRAWIYGYYVDIDEVAYDKLPIITVSPDAIDESGVAVDRSIFPETTLTDEDVWSILQRHEEGLAKDTTILGKIFPKYEELKAMDTSEYGRSSSISNHEGYEKYYGKPRIQSYFYIFRHAIIIMLIEGAEFSSDEYEYILDYVVVALENARQYEIITSYEPGYDSVLIHGRAVNSVEHMVLIAKNKDRRYRYFEVRNDIVLAYFVDWRSKTWWKVQERDVRTMGYVMYSEE